MYTLHVYGVFIYIKINYMYIRRCERARDHSYAFGVTFARRHGVH